MTFAPWRETFTGPLRSSCSGLHEWDNYFSAANSAVWLFYREQPILGRPLTVDEVGYVSAVARRIAALLLLGPDLDANYRRVKSNSYLWPR
jgi:hypothetical protein